MGVATSVGIDVGAEQELNDLRSDIAWLLERRDQWGTIDKDHYEFLVQRETELLDQLA